MRDWITNVVVCASVSLVPVILGISRCEQSEVCDGIDNDGDGQIDEDFDQDADGYQDASECSSGTDCNDFDSSVHPNAPEPADGLDNDCDGQIDEDQQAYTIRFVSRYTEVPMPGVAVWLGLDGSGPLTFSGEDGIATLYLESPAVDWSFAYHYTTSYRDYRSIYSYLSDTLEADQTVQIYDANMLGERREMSGTVSGVDPSVSSAVFVSAGNSYVELEPSASSVAYDFSPYASRATYLLVSQNQVEEDGYAWSGSIPLAYNLILDPEDVNETALSRTFDQRATFSLSNVDASMTSTWHDVRLGLPDAFATSLYFDDGEIPLSDPSSDGIDIPSLTDDLASVSLLVEPWVYSDDGSQGATIPWSGGSGTVAVALPSLHSNSGTPAVDAFQLPGLTVDVMGDEAGDREHATYVDYDEDLETGMRYRHGWSVYTADRGAPITFPEIPEGAFAWPDEGSSSREFLLQAAYTAVFYGADDEEPGHRFAYVDMPVSSDVEASARVAAPQRRQMRATRQHVSMEAPIVIRGH